MPEVEIFTPTGVLMGTTDWLPHDGSGVEAAALDLVVESPRRYPLDETAPSRSGDVRVSPDDALVIVIPAPRLRIHMNWYPITVQLGPYRVSGKLGTLPGFDPGRALARPGGSYVPLRGATVELLGRDDVRGAARDHVLVNRYAVERVESQLMLAHYFPGARVEASETVPVA